ncbi:hypothetical protein [Cobetia sp.]|uniref:hypothetical protein n=1 Tax=Cobetia sp. TaxID=1873876 RepID=UPI00257F3E33|nr:hypothetical protein [Cobetia sp.]|tara:strand:- start:1882 stop:3126 length:1245 start_codon:yes stop_codon:yes gene_type:complete
MNYNDYILFVPGTDKKNNTVVAFSAATVPKGKFSFSNLFSNKSFNTILVNTSNNNWYNGDGNSALTCKQYAKAITDLIEDNNLTGSIIALGGSMGAYGAINIGKLINADTIIAFGLEHKLFMHGSKSEKYYIEKNLKIIPNISKGTEFHGEQYVVTGGRDLIDYYNSMVYCKKQNISLFLLPDKPHSLPPYIFNKISPNRLLHEEKISSSLLCSCLGAEQELPKDIDIVFASKLLDSIQFLKQNNAVFEEKCDILNECYQESYNNILKAHYLKLMAEIEVKKKNFPDALELYYKALNLFPGFKEIYAPLVAIQRRFDLSLSLELSERFIDSHQPELLDPNLQMLYQHGINRYSNKEYSEAIDLLEDFSRSRPFHEHAAFLILQSKNQVQSKMDYMRYYNEYVERFPNSKFNPQD